ncbi:uncharacterized protein [Antennarius striatus]|uniref:uncharacterized protein n=1 Tax=Antennarius striatus TaxID=241820 RepID=UPI0035AEE234
MFSDSSAPAPGEQKGFKSHAPHFIPWLRNSLKPHHSSDLGLNGPYKPSSEVRNNLTHLERAKGIGFFSIQGKDRAKKGELRCNRVGMARMLPVVLRGHHILPGGLGKQRKDSPPRWNQSPELQPERNMQMCLGERLQGLSSSPPSAQDNLTFVRNPSSQLNLPQSQNDCSSTLIRKYGPLAGPPSAPSPDEANLKAPVVVVTDDKRGKVSHYGSSTIYQQKDLHLSNWLNSDTSFSDNKHRNMISKSHRDLTALREPPVEGVNGPLNGVIFSTEVPQEGINHNPTLQGSSKSRPNQNQACVQYSPTNDRGVQKKEAGCTRTVVRNQIKRVVVNLEQVLRALRDIHQEMKEVVQQIDYLTSSIELSEEEQWRTTGGDNTELVSDASSGSDTGSSEATAGNTHQRCVKPGDQAGTTDSSASLRRDHHSRRQSPPHVLLRLSSERTDNIQYTSSLGLSSRQGLSLQYNNNRSSCNPLQLQNVTSHDLTSSPQRSLPGRPPTPGLSPITVNLHHSNSSTSQLHSSRPCSSIKVSPPSTLSPQTQPPPTFSSSVIVRNETGSCDTQQGDHPSAGQLSPSSTQPPSVGRPPTDTESQTLSNDDGERLASSAGSIHRPQQMSTATTAKPPTGQGRRGRKPPPYPHNKTSESTKKVKEPRKAPPYPEKRRLLLTTV